MRPEWAVVVDGREIVKSWDEALMREIAAAVEGARVERTGADRERAA